MNSLKQIRRHRTLPIALGLLALLGSSALNAAGPLSVAGLVHCLEQNLALGEPASHSAWASPESSYVEKFSPPGKIRFETGEEIPGASFQEHCTPERIQALQQQPPHQVLARAVQDPASGGGELRLLRLNYNDYNAFPYNLKELALLIRNNPRLANSMGFYKVKDTMDLVWLPDDVALNARIRQLSREHGFEDSVYQMSWDPVGYPGQNAEILQPLPFLKVIAAHHFPMSRVAIGTVHDGMHGVTLAVLSATKHGRKVLQAFESRASAFVRIADRLEAELPASNLGYASPKKMAISRWSEATKALGGMPFERNMMLSHFLTGNDAYTNPNVFDGPGFRQFTRPELQKKIEGMFEVFEYGQTDGSSVLSPYSPQSTEQVINNYLSSITDSAMKAQVKAIIDQETAQIIHTTPEIRESAALEVMKFAPAKAIASDDAP